MAYTNIDDPSAHFQTALYTGTGAAHSIGNDGNSDLKPDWVWIKKRSASGNNSVFDSTRGVYEELVTNGENAEASDVQLLTQFDTDGFTVGTNGGVNGSGATFVGWQWKANGGTTASNTDGSITSTVQANTDAGFSIVTYTGTGVYNKTVGHGLGIAPAVVILKNRTTGEASYDDWWVYHKDTSNPVNRALRLNETGAEQSSTVFWSVVPSSTIFGVGGSVDAPRYTNGASQNYVAYCFAEKQGYSKFGKYVGNGNVNGPMVYLGFKPAVIILKRSDSATGGNWHIIDNKRSASGGANVNVYSLFPNLDAAESTGEAESTYGIDFLSNGFKIRASHSTRNTSGGSYIYMAFAENPFTTSTGIPTTAR